MPGSQTSLVSAYDRMQSTFAEHGLDVPFIAGLRSVSQSASRAVLLIEKAACCWSHLPLWKLQELIHA